MAWWHKQYALIKIHRAREKKRVFFMARNKDNHNQNRGMLHGRWHGSPFCINGRPNGFGDPGVVTRELHRAVFLPMSVVVDEMGLGETGSPVAQEERQSTTKIVMQIGKATRNSFGEVIAIRWTDAD